MEPIGFPKPEIVGRGKMVPPPGYVFEDGKWVKREPSSEEESRKDSPNAQDEDSAAH